MRITGLLLAATLLAGAAHANELEGVWLFEKETNVRADGTRANVPDIAYDGVLIYTADGYVSATIMPRGRAWTLATAKLADLMGSVGEGASSAYAGRYVIDGKNHRVTHTPLVSVDPADLGRPLPRGYSVQGDVLELSGTWKHEGEQLTFIVRWKRAPREH